MFFGLFLRAAIEGNDTNLFWGTCLLDTIITPIYREIAITYVQDGKSSGLVQDPEVVFSLKWQFFIKFHINLMLIFYLWSNLLNLIHVKNCVKLATDSTLLFYPAVTVHCKALCSAFLLHYFNLFRRSTDFRSWRFALTFRGDLAIKQLVIFMFVCRNLSPAICARLRGDAL